MKEISAIICVEKRTISRQRNERNLSQISFTNDGDVNSDKKCNISLLLKELLKSKGIIVPRLRLRDSFHRVDETGVSWRKKVKHKRRVYNVKVPNELWLIDTNHKLVRWCTITFNTVNGFSQLPITLECAANNMSEILLSYFMKGVQIYGSSSRVWSDKRKENVLITDFMIANRGPERGSMICGKSTQNQRIKRL